MNALPWYCALLLTVLGSWSSLRADDYDPLRIPKDDVRSVELTVKDTARKRDIPLGVYLPVVQDAKPEAAPVVLFSHGLGGNREGSAYLGKHWAARGYVAVFLQHPGSDDSVWKDVPLAQRMAALKEAASIANYLLRIQDVTAVLDQLEKWNAEAKHELAGKLDLKKVGMSGHSFGAGTTQGLSGQAGKGIGQRYTDARIKAAIPMSPSSPRDGDTKTAFGSVKIPWMLMTGTHDDSPIGNQTPESRLKVFLSLPAGNKYQLVLDKAEHSVFTERALPGEKQKRNPNHHRVILATSTAFWDAYLRDDRTAKEWLLGTEPRKLMESGDVWEKK